MGFGRSKLKTAHPVNYFPRLLGKKIKFCPPSMVKITRNHKRSKSGKRKSETRGELGEGWKPGLKAEIGTVLSAPPDIPKDWKFWCRKKQECLEKLSKLSTYFLFCFLFCLVCLFVFSCFRSFFCFCLVSILFCFVFFLFYFGFYLVLCFCFGLIFRRLFPKPLILSFILHK